MRSTAEPLEDNKVKLTIDIRDDELAPFVDSSVRKIAREVRIPGFRPGKAPRKVVETRVGIAALRREAIEEALESYYRKALFDNDIDAIASPNVDIVEGEEAGDVKVDAVIEVRPTVTVEGYGAIEVEVPSWDIDDSDIDESLRTLQEQYGTLKEVERPVQDGDQVTIDLDLVVDGEVQESSHVSDLSIRIGRNQADDAMEAALLGRTKGETIDVPIEGDDKRIRRVTIGEIKEIELPVPTDEFAADVSEFDTLEELRADIRKQLVSMRSEMAKRSYRGEIIDRLVELVEPKEVPDALLSAQAESELHQFGHQLQSQGLTLQRYMEITGQNEPQLLASVYESARRSVLLDLALRAIAVNEAVELGETEVEDEIEKMASSPQNDRKTVEEYYEDPTRRRDFTVDLMKNKAFERLLEIVTIKDSKGKVLTVAELDADAEDEGDAS